MKKLLLLILAFLLSFSMVACDIQSILDGLMPSSSSSYDEEEEEEEEDEDDEEQQSSSSVPDMSHIYGEDKTVYTNTITEDGKWMYGDKALAAPTFANYYNGYKSALTFTFDDGYDIGTGRYVNSVFDQYGWRGTAMLGPCFLSEELVAQWNTVLAEGYLDVGCHGYDHKNPVGLDSAEYEHEIKDAIEYLRTNFPGQRVLTYATPFAHIDSPYQDYLDDLVISNRLEADGKLVKVGDDYDLYQVRSYSFNKNNVVDAWNQSIGTKLNEDGTWVVELVHCVLDSPYNNTDTSKEKFSAHSAYLYNNYKDTVWFASFEDVSIYLKQVESAKINYVASDRESMTINVTCPLDETIYNFPMTVKMRVPSYATSAYAVIDGEVQMLQVTKGSGMNVVTVKDIPVNGENVKIYLGGNYNYANGCSHLWSNKRVSATCKDMGYMLYECAFCKATYKNEFAKTRDHAFGEREIIEIPTLTEDGLEKISCSDCGTEKEIVTSLKNLAPGATISASAGINEWVYTADMIDGNIDSKWTCGTDAPSVQLTFAKSSIQYVEISVSKYGGAEMLAISTYDGEEWTQIAVDEVIDGDGVITVRVEVGAEASSVKFDISGTASGCTMIHEITVIAKIDK
ncbi:MAG: hypothetical protein E7622_06760 [Ruminococcaceae bacterium]|nr:hypothetical protein [Oscillospiraceae bacterium]